MLTHHLFMTDSHPPTDDHGILDLGKNCHFCNQLDFLPFDCEYCSHTYCSRHRGLDRHQCVGRPQRERLAQRPTTPEQSAAALFPDHDQRRAKLELLLHAAAPTSIAQLVGSNPLNKLTRFLHAQRMKRQRLLSRNTSPALELSGLRKVAKGPPSVPVADRVYLWALYVNGNEEELAALDAEKLRRGVWVLKNWSVGRTLDALADTLGISNRNNATQLQAERLNLFEVKNDAPVALETAKKLVVAPGSTVYLVRGKL